MSAPNGGRSGGLRDAINALPDGLLFDADDRVIIRNHGFLDDKTRSVIDDAASLTFEDTLRTFVENGMLEAQDQAFDREALDRPAHGAPPAIRPGARSR